MNTKPANTSKDNMDTRNYIDEARIIVEHLHALLHEDAKHRLKLHDKYAYEPGNARWSPDLYRRCQLVDALRNKLNGYNESLRKNILHTPSPKF